MKNFCITACLLTALVLVASVANSQGPAMEGGPYRLTSMWLGDGRSLGADESGSMQIQLYDSKVRNSQHWYLQLESNGYYHLINMRFPRGVLDIANDGINNNKVFLGKINNYSGQYWKLTPQGDGTFHRLTTLWMGEEKSLDVVNDGNNRELRLAPTGNYSGQFWKLTKVDDEQVRVAEAIDIDEALVQERQRADQKNIDDQNRQQVAIIAEQQRIAQQQAIDAQNQAQQAAIIAAEQQRLIEQNRQQAAIIAAQQQAIQQAQRQKEYTVGIDCKGYSTLTNTETNDFIIVTFIDVNDYKMGDRGKAITSCEVDTYFSVSGNNIAALQISTQGSDAFWMDQAWLLQDGREIARWGKNEGGGYCFSRDPADANGGFKDFISSRGCKDCMRFDVTTGEVTECRNVLLRGN